MEQHTKHIVDSTLGVAAISSPWWMQLLQTGVGMFMLLGGALLLALRLAIAWREWRHPVGK